MKRKIVSGKDLGRLGFVNANVIGIAINTIYKFYRHESKDEIYSMLRDVVANPGKFLDDPVWCTTALAILPQQKQGRAHKLNSSRIPYATFGAQGIEESARNQMEIAMKLPVAVAGALMPDAHYGYGLPIGGVLATRNEVIPYAVGLDIGCRMSLSVYPLEDQLLERHRVFLKKSLIENTRFGNDQFEKPLDHEVLNRKVFDELPVLRKLKGKAAWQIGTSGSGNHFVEFGIVKLNDGNAFGLEACDYLGILSHSGSRGLGAEIARHFTAIAKETCLLPSHATNMAWLDLETDAGAQYWMAMNLAGDYAVANHEQIHHRLSAPFGLKAILTVQNHHNFAWQEMLDDGRLAIVHRKGATPAADGVLGIIPGSMTQPGFIVRGKGSPPSLRSASHGAGRIMSRGEAKTRITSEMVRRALESSGVELIGGAIDEAPMVYKDIFEIMKSQRDLVAIEGQFFPKIVRMSGQGQAGEN